jgi:hypothetical protein
MDYSSYMTSSYGPGAMAAHRGTTLTTADHYHSTVDTSQGAFFDPDAIIDSGDAERFRVDDALAELQDSIDELNR